ncbi:TetR/AcrR family transcriptional regulator [Neobacillus jeddahensis]|uniref:TetR/AcrR family transcriptional regulator n=1 Tax=Neobacillus jeddahensis TaxID=1461580 RepID=UPI000590B349|nr:TetR/AcrR family transcriptional regulator [Neobacillus jeddahensis]
MIKKQLIMEKALELFAKQGFATTTVQQITDYCGISKGAFYLSFKSKDELILALIDHFMIQITSNIDYIVNNIDDDAELLYTFYYAMFESFHKHSDFAKLFIKEQSHTFNEEFIVKMQYYDKLSERMFLSLIERLYGETVNRIKYDLIYCIKGFMNTYSSLFLFYNVPLDLKVLAQSLVEKTNLLARQMTVPFISPELWQLMEQPLLGEVTKEQLRNFIDQKVDELEESVEKESLLLLKEQLIASTYPQAVVRGLLENVRNHPECKWISYLLRRYYQF